MFRAKSTYIFLLICGLWQTTSCYYDVEEELYPNGPQCDTTNVTFKNQITITLQTYCLNCHNTAAAPASGGGIMLDNYNGVKAQVDRKKLVAAVKHLPGASAMPKGGPKIPPCDIAFIETWVNAGAPNN